MTVFPFFYSFHSRASPSLYCITSTGKSLQAAIRRLNHTLFRLSQPLDCSGDSRFNSLSRITLDPFQTKGEGTILLLGNVDFGQFQIDAESRPADAHVSLGSGDGGTAVKE